MIDRCILRTFDGELIQRDDVFQFQKRPLAILGIGVGCLLVALGLAAAGLVLAPSAAFGAEGWFLIGAGSLVAIASLVSLAGALVLALSDKLRVYGAIDTTRRELCQRRRQIPFHEISRFQVLPVGTRFLSLAAVVRDGGSIPLFTIGASQRASLEELAGRFSGFLAEEKTSTLILKGAEAPTLVPALQRLFGITALAIGVLWTAAGYFFFSGLYFTGRVESSGPRIPVWWLGFAFIGVGLYKFWKSRDELRVKIRESGQEREPTDHAS